MIDLPNGTVTFLFTNIEGSTRLPREYPNSWKDLHSWHDAIFRESIEFEPQLCLFKPGRNVLLSLPKSPGMLQP